jgi:hypothetical protein
MRCAVFACVVVAALAPVAVAQARAPLGVSPSISPSPAFFGERITARAEVVVDRHAVHPSAVRFAPNFTPYAIVEGPHRSRSDSGSITTLGYVYTLLCLNDDCLPGERMRTVRLPQARVSAGAEGVVVRWPKVLVSTRVSGADTEAARPPWRVQLAVPAVSYRVRPATASVLAAAAAVLFGLLGLVLLGWEAARRRRLRLARERALSRIQLALALLRESAGRTADDRRKALAFVARELNGEVDLAREATRLAWARAEPSPERVDTIARRVEERLARR